MTCEHEWEMMDSVSMTSVDVVYCTTMKTATVSGGDTVLVCPLCGSYALVSVHCDVVPEVIKEGRA
jgi:hypothetical protein